MDEYLKNIETFTHIPLFVREVEVLGEAFRGIQSGFQGVNVVNKAVFLSVYETALLTKHVNAKTTLLTLC